jgi:hypothetical protein
MEFVFFKHGGILFLPGFMPIGGELHLARAADLLDIPGLKSILAAILLSVKIVSLTPLLPPIGLGSTGHA